jgi:23S rRNA (uracil1939-C5)-methyltransferase
MQSHRNLGFHQQGQFSKIIDIDHCYLIDEQLNAIFIYCKKILSQFEVYDQKTHKGFLRHLMLRQ